MTSPPVSLQETFELIERLTAPRPRKVEDDGPTAIAGAQ